MDEQTTPKKVRRVGSIAFALVLIAAGVLLIVYQFVPQFDLLKILNSPRSSSLRWASRCSSTAPGPM